MLRCVELAKNGAGSTYPNPLVGAVIVHNDRIIAEGWHRAAGLAHAEVNAISRVEDIDLLEKSTLYVNLEPCSHFGKTPPCADLIIEKKIKNVVIGSLDPNPKVSGRGIAKLKAAGHHVISGILEEECDELNKRFFIFHRKKRPYVILKWAETADGFIAPVKRSKTAPVWISSKRSRQWVHKIRSQEQAILIGTQTALDDNPSLTTRYWEGDSPLRVVVDKELRISRSARLLDGNYSTLVLTKEAQTGKANIQYEQLNFEHPLPPQILDKLYELGIQSLIVEGGRKTLQSFIDHGLWDEALVFRGPKSFNGGIAAPKLRAVPVYEKSWETDKVSFYKNSDS